MDNKVLDDIKKFAIAQLQSNYGFCGCADGPEFAMLNSDDNNGRDIKITIKIEDE